MKKIFFFTVFLIIFSGFGIACAQQEVHVINGRTYYCGDTLELIFPDEPLLLKEFTRGPGWGYKVVQARTDKDHILVSIRVKLRNMSNVVYKGFDPGSFRLIGYVRGKPIEYYPEVMEPFDNGDGKTYYNLYDKMHYRNNWTAPLHQIDMILVYNIHSIVRDLELHVNPKGNDGTTDTYMDAHYGEMELEPCDAVFQFLTVHNSETNQMIKYYR